MTDKQPEALRLADEAWNFDCSEYRGVRSANAAMMGKLQDCADMIRKLHTENTALQQGYAAARLEIESLKACTLSEPVAWLVCTEEGDPDMVFLSQRGAGMPTTSPPTPPHGLLLPRWHCTL